VIEQLDGRPAAPRLRQLIASIGDRLDEPRPSHAFARYSTACLRALDVRRHRRPPGPDLRGRARPRAARDAARRPDRTTRRDLATAATRVGGGVAALLRSPAWGARRGRARGTDPELAAAYAACGAIGFHTPSEQSGMLLVNHTLTGLAIGAPKP